MSLITGGLGPWRTYVGADVVSISTLTEEVTQTVGENAIVAIDTMRVIVVDDTSNITINADNSTEEVQ